MRRICVILFKSPTHSIARRSNIINSGGLGLTGGFADVGSLYDCLAGIHDDELDLDILDKYSEVRMKIWRDMIGPLSCSNSRRLWDENAKEERGAFFKMCERATEDPVWGKGVEEAIHAIRHDFTKYYKSKQAATEMK